MQILKSLQLQPVTRRSVFNLLVSGVVLGTALTACGGGDDDKTKWAASWYAAQSDATESLPPLFAPEAAKILENQTIRQVVYVSGGGDRVRVKLSNLFGPSSVTFDAVTVATPSGAGANVDPTTSHAVLFGGSVTVTLDPGTETFSDPVDFHVDPNTTVAVSIYVKNQTEARTVHRLARQRNYVASGNVTTVAAPNWTEINDTAAALNPGGFTAWVSELDVLRNDSPKVVVAFGDSITDGFASTIDANNRWPNVLSRLLAAAPAAFGAVSVVDAGISGNRWKTDFEGPKGEFRFARDALGVSGATHIVILLGINDIGFDNFAPEQATEASTISAAIQASVDQAKSRGLKVIVGTLTPFKATPIYYSDAREAKRQAVNDFIRNSLQRADAVVDFDKLLRDPVSPLQMIASFDSGDHLHPNDAGYAVMAQSVADSLATIR